MDTVVNAISAMKNFAGSAKHKIDLDTHPEKNISTIVFFVEGNPSALFVVLAGPCVVTRATIPADDAAMLVYGKTMGQMFAVGI